MLQEGHDVLEEVFVGQLLLGERPYYGVEHQEGEMVDEQPCRLGYPKTNGSD